MDCPNPKESAARELPADALAEILYRLPVKPLLRFRCVARGWRDLIDDPLRRTRFPQTLQGFLLVAEAIHDGSDGGHRGFVDLQRRPSVPLDIDPSFSFLTSLPGIETLTFSDSCNGLLLFEHGQASDPTLLVSGYVVCSPATKGSGEVPTCDCPPPGFDEARYTYLVFDPAVSNHFHLVQFWDERYQLEHEEFYITVHAYSSETGIWSCSKYDWKTEEEQGQLEWWRHRGLTPCQAPRRAFVNGMLHFIILDQHQIVAVDVQGKTRRIIPFPTTVEGERWPSPGYIAQSQGRLHYINLEPDAHDCEQSSRLSIWVLKDYDAQEWELLDTVRFLKLFGEQSCTNRDFRLVSVHPHCNVVFFVQTLNRNLISYDMDHKEVSVVGTFENERRHMHIVPYVPYFVQSPALTNML